MELNKKTPIIMIVILLSIVFGVRVWKQLKLKQKNLNVILLTLDSVNVKHLGFMGYKRSTTPILDSIAQDSMIFENTFSSASWTSPGLHSVFTGLYPTLHGVEARGRSLIPGTITIFDVFKAHEYQVPNISYLTQIPNYFFLGLDQEQPQLIKNSAYNGEDLIQWLGKKHSKPFLLWYHYSSLHLPYKPKEKFNQFLTDSMRFLLKSENLRTLQENAVIPMNSIEFSTEEKEVVKALYDGQLRELDDLIGKMMYQLKKQGIDQQTIIVITADHGEELFEHGFIGHASTTHRARLYDETIKIPFIIYDPTEKNNRKRIRVQVRQVDIMPTLADYMGFKVPNDLNGKSVLDLAKGKKMPRLDSFAESVIAGYQSTPAQEKIKIRSIRLQKHKLICIEDNISNPCELYDIKSDPGERENIISENSSIPANLKGKIRNQLSEMNFARLSRLTTQKVEFSLKDVPKGKTLTKPIFVFPKKNQVIEISKACEKIKIDWSGDSELTYVIQYDIGLEFKNLKGKIPVKGTFKNFGLLPSHICDLLPVWNPYKIRVSPYGLDHYWSEWIDFSFARTNRG
jgi:arylsulfatase A-like enzyme